MVVDDHPFVREGVDRLISASIPGSHVHHAHSICGAMETLRNQPIELVVMDISMPEGDGISATQKIREQNEKIKIIILTVHESVHIMERCFAAGANAFLTKRCLPDELHAAINGVLSGNRYISGDIDFKGQKEAQSDAASKLETLTKRERQVFDRLSSGRSPSEIAEDLCISRKTVYVHRKNIFEKLDIKTNYELHLLRRCAEKGSS